MTRSTVGPSLLAWALIVWGFVPSNAPLVLGSEGVVYTLPFQSTFTQVRWDLEFAVLNLVNHERLAAMLRPLTPHAVIRRAARIHGLEMFAFGYLSHQSLDGQTPLERISKMGIRVRFISENIAYAPDIRSAHETLMASVDHRRNILSPQHRLVGVGVIDGGSMGVIVVEDFSD